MINHSWEQEIITKVSCWRRTGRLSIVNFFPLYTLKESKEKKWNVTPLPQIKNEFALKPDKPFFHHLNWNERVGDLKFSVIHDQNIVFQGNRCPTVAIKCRHDDRYECSDNTTGSEPDLNPHDFCVTGARLPTEPSCHMRTVVCGLALHVQWTLYSSQVCEFHGNRCPTVAI